MRTNFGKEALCLRRLEGLAIPKLVHIPRKEIEALLGGIPCEYIAQEFVQGTPFIGKDRTAAEMIGLWCFFVEQLCAIRRVGIVYTDVKVTNMILGASPTRLTIIDFGNAQAIETTGKYSNYELHYTAGFEAPEQTWAKYLTEASFVYQLGMTIAYALVGLNNLTLRNGSSGKVRLTKELAKGGGPELLHLVGDCLCDDRARRPATYEVVLRRLYALRRRKQLTDETLSWWKLLRDPYASILEDVELRWPK